MKKKVFVLFVMCLCTFNGLCAIVGGGDNIILTVVWDDPSDESTPIPKTPVPPLIISQDGNILTLPATSVDYTLQLRDENGIVVYSSYIPAGTTQIILPATLSGEFEIRFVAATYYYIGYISL